MPHRRHKNNSATIKQSFTAAHSPTLKSPNFSPKVVVANKQKKKSELFYEFENFVDVIPVDNVPKAFHEFGAVVFVIHVVGMLPHI